MGYIVIHMQMQSKIGNQIISKAKTIIRDEVSLTTFNDKKQTLRTFKTMKKQGKDCSLEKGIIIERFKGMIKDRIADKIEADLEKTANQLKKIIKVKYWREYEK